MDFSCVRVNMYVKAIKCFFMVSEMMNINVTFKHFNKTAQQPQISATEFLNNKRPCQHKSKCIHAKEYAFETNCSKINFPFFLMLRLEYCLAFFGKFKTSVAHKRFTYK